jgi:hypothetical protein
VDRETIDALERCAIAAKEQGLVAFVNPKALLSLIADWRRKERELRSAKAVVHGLIDSGPYQNEDGECSFCLYAPAESEDLDNLIQHQDRCEYRRGKEWIAAHDEATK